LPDGVPDPSLGNGAVKRFPPIDIPGTDGWLNLEAGPAAVAANGDSFVSFTFSGHFSGDRGNGIGVLKFDSTGAPDQGYGISGGMALPPDLHTSGMTEVTSVSVTENGQVRLIGTSYPEGREYGNDQNVFAATIAPDGVTSSPIEVLPDDGQFFLHDAEPNAEGWAIALMEDASRGNSGTRDRDLVGGRFDFNGLPDFEFDSDDGLVGAAVGIWATASAVTVGPDQAMSLAGSARAERCSRGDSVAYCGRVGTIARFDREGEIDRAFGEGGILTLPELECPGNEQPEVGPHACRMGTAAGPEIQGRFLGRTLADSRLVVDVKPAVGSDSVRPWRQLGVIPLRGFFRPSVTRRTRVLTTHGRTRERLERPGLTLSGNGGGTLMLRRVWNARFDSVRFIIPRSALDLNRQIGADGFLGLRASFSAWRNVKSKTATVRVPLPD
jgi:hypothetical protein